VALPNPRNLPILRTTKKMAAPVVLNAPGAKPLNLERAAKWIITQKAEKSWDAMNKLAQRNKWPRREEEVFSYLGRTGSTRQFKKLRVFWAFNMKNPGLFPKTWRYEPLAVGSFEDLKRAADFAFRRARNNALKNIDTGDYRRSFAYLYREKAGEVPRFLVGAATVTLEDPSAELIIINTADYASSLEAHAFQRARNGGIMHQAAKETAKKFPNVNVRFSYTNLDKLGFGLQHKYAVPYIRIGLRRGAVKPYFSRPGRNIRRRATAYAKRAPNERAFYEYNRAMRGARSKYLARQDDRHFGDDLYSYQRFRARIKRKR
jgi:hypothetical protein